MNLSPVWIQFGVALLLFLVGLLIHLTQRIELLNMIDARRVGDRAGLARFAARFLYAMAATFLACALLSARYGTRDEFITAAAVVTVVLSLWLTIAAQRYVSPRQ